MSTREYFSSRARVTINRRQFVRSTLLFSAASVAAPAFLRAQNVNNKLNIGMIACGGRGGDNLEKIKGENIVALCDVAEDRLNRAGARFPKARKYTDFRKLLDQSKDVDAVVVSTAEHTHAFATLGRSS
jgi:hypothetical protein